MSQISENKAEEMKVTGSVNKEETKDNQFPKGIYDYWNAYEARKANKRTTPKNLIDYFRKGIEEFQNNGSRRDPVS